MKKLQIKYSFIIFISFSIALTPIDMLLPMIASICIHEAGHIVPMVLLGAKIQKITLGACGLDISSPMQALNYKKAAIVYLGGSLFNMLSACVSTDVFPRFAYCSIAYGVINLLPVKPLDGAMALLSVLCMRMLPEMADRLLCFVSVIFLLPLWMFSLYVFFYGATNITPLVMCVFLFLSVFSKKHGKIQ